MSSLPEDELRRRLKIWQDAEENYNAAAKTVGISPSSFRSSIERAKRLGLEPESALELPSFPDDDLGPEEILDHLERAFAKQDEHQKALRWFEIKIPEDQPIAINWFGDPHIGSPGMDVRRLREDVRLVLNTPGMYAANIGDTTDNWGKRLNHLYSETTMSKQRERTLAQWFLEQAGIPWLLWLEGNHDAMDPAFTTHLRAINANRIPMIDWRAKFKIVFPNGQEFKVDAAHNHKGHSMWNPLHGQVRAAKMASDDVADLYIAGHHHEWMLAREELPSGRVVSYVRCRGYKIHDDFAHRHQFDSQSHGCSIVTVFDPLAKGARRMKAFEDTGEGAEFLGWLRKKRR